MRRGSFANGNLNIRLGIQQANTASFNSDYLGPPAPSIDPILALF
jgi:hypothetical protein